MEVSDQGEEVGHVDTLLPVVSPNAATVQARISGQREEIIKTIVGKSL